MVKKPPLVYPLLVSLFSLVFIWFFLFCFAPKIEAIFNDVGGREIFLREWALEFPIRWGSQLYPWFWLPVTLTVLGLLFTLFPFFGAKIKLAAAWFSLGWSLLLLALAGWSMAAAALGSSMATLAQDGKLRVSESVLREFLLLEAAQNRHEAITRRIGEMMNARPVEVHSTAEFTVTERRDRLNSLIGLIAKPQEAGVKKRLLASSLLFRADIKPDSSQAKTLLREAEAATGQTFENTGTFFVWLESRTGQEGWDPLPLYRFVKK